MSDEEEYTNLDLETAEQLMFAAGKPELSKALHHHAHGVRNLVQGEWGKSFVNSLEDLLIKHIDPLAASQKETQDGVAALSGLFQSLAESVDGLQAGFRRARRIGGPSMRNWQRSKPTSRNSKRNSPRMPQGQSATNWTH